MYSLYRAWMSMGPTNLPFPTVPVQNNPLNLSTPSQTTPGQFSGRPDVTLQVGPTMTHFSAHRSVICTHSGYFKAALANYAGPAPLHVPNVNVDEFCSLLTYMYTGYLDLNLSNIYAIILATHTLHMPRALELCRNYLAQSQNHRQPSDDQIQSPIKPIPSRRPPQNSQIFAPARSNFHKSESTPFKAVSTARPSTSKSETLQIAARPERNPKTKKPPNESVVVDVASCDGPVRFHRVLNQNYGLYDPETDPSNQVSNHEKPNHEMNQAMNRAMNETIRDRRKTDENRPAGDMFTCPYCNHTFKSQYCYQKHARRHLNPVINSEGKSPGNPDSAKREVKPLDMNVQYYPCKMCGSKFPSYYFVHKHRKMCHAEQVAGGNEEAEAEAEGGNEEAMVEGENGRRNEDTNDSDKTSVLIDVETDECK